MTRMIRYEPASRLQIKFLEFLCRRAELAKLVNGRARGRKSERLKRFGEQLVEVGLWVRDRW